MNTAEANEEGDILDMATAHLRESRVDSEPSTELIDQTVAAMQSVGRRTISWRTMALVAASVLLVMGSVSWFISQGSGEIAFADVIQQVMQTKSFQATIIQMGDDREPGESARLSVKGPRGRFDTDDGLIIIDDDKTGEAITLDRAARLARRSSEPVNGKLDVYAELREIGSQVPKSIGRKNFGGRMLDGFSGSVTLSGKSGVGATVWVDRETKLPVRIELSPKAGGPAMTVIEDLKFDVALDDSMFDMTVPAGYEVRATLPTRDGRRRRESASTPTTEFAMPTVEVPLPALAGPAPTTRELERMVLKPGIGIGELNFGASRAEIVKVMGEPQGILRRGALEILEYASVGVVLTIDEANGLQVIVASGPSVNHSLKMRPFAGSTDKGVRIGSGRREIEAAYGKDYVSMPVTVKDHPEVHRTELMYDRLGFSVILDSESKECAALWLMAPAAMNAATRPGE